MDASLPATQCVCCSRSSDALWSVVCPAPGSLRVARAGIGLCVEVLGFSGTCHRDVPIRMIGESCRDLRNDYLLACRIAWCAEWLVIDFMA